MTPQAGDIGLARGKDFVDACIRWAEARRYGKTSPEARFNHAFFVATDAGDLIEAQAQGIARTSLGQYGGQEHMILRPAYPDDVGRQRAIHSANAAVGEKYGYLAIACEALAFLTGTRLRFGVSGQHICSGAVSHWLAFGGIDMGDDEEWNSPADVMHIALLQRWSVVE